MGADAEALDLAWGDASDSSWWEVHGGRVDEDETGGMVAFDGGGAVLRGGSGVEEHGIWDGWCMVRDPGADAVVAAAAVADA